MRPVDFDLAENLPDGWLEKADGARGEVESAGTQNDRAALIAKYSDLWRELKPTISGGSNGKCWYCEAKELRSDNAVDHFRPKNRIAEREDHDGYWWLAFDPDNYRFSCTFCNSHRVDRKGGTQGGKHDHFPLLYEGGRAMCPDDDCEREQILLLDPRAPGDPELLWFDEDGNPSPNPRFCSKETGYRFKRASTSIELYHLRAVGTVESRLDIANRIKRILSGSDRAFQRYDAGDMSAKVNFADSIRELRITISENAEYSAAARCTLMGLRATSPVAAMVLES